MFECRHQTISVADGIWLQASRFEVYVLRTFQTLELHLSSVEDVWLVGI